MIHHSTSILYESCQILHPLHSYLPHFQVLGDHLYAQAHCFVGSGHHLVFGNIPIELGCDPSPRTGMEPGGCLHQKKKKKEEKGKGKERKEKGKEKERHKKK